VKSQKSEVLFAFIAVNIILAKVTMIMYGVGGYEGRRFLTVPKWSVGGTTYMRYVLFIELYLKDSWGFFVQCTVIEQYVCHFYHVSEF